jgi:hypothetical protein
MGFSQIPLNPLDPLTCHVINGLNLMTAFIANNAIDDFSEYTSDMSMKTGLPTEMLREDIEHALHFIDVLNKAAHISGARRVCIKEKPPTPPIEYMI